MNVSNRPHLPRRIHRPWRSLAPTLVAVIAGVGALAMASAAEARVRVVATLPDLGAIAEEVGGDLVTVDVLAAPNQDPHFVDARPNHVVTLSRADMLLTNGMSLESAWLDPLVLQARNPAIQVGGAAHFVASSCVDALGTERPLDRAMGDVHPGGNPHFLLDARAGAAVTRCVGEWLAAVDGDNAATYRANADAMATSLDAFATAQRARFDSLPEGADVVIAYHDSLPYLMEWLGLTQAGTLEPRPGVAPSPNQVASVVSTARSSGARAVVQEEFYPTATGERVAEMAGLGFVVLEGGSRDDETYQEHLEHNTEALFEALSE